MIDLEEMIAMLNDDAGEEYIKFDRVEKPLHLRPDICAFLLLDKLVPGTTDMVTAAEHDEIWLDIDLSKLAEAAAPADILTLIRCGVRYDENNDSLAMFV